MLVDGGRVRLRVRDNGPGVPEDLRDAVFVRGFSTKPEVLGGRGIGLPLVRLICTQRGGRSPSTPRTGARSSRWCSRSTGRRPG